MLMQVRAKTYHDLKRLHPTVFAVKRADVRSYIGWIDPKKEAAHEAHARRCH